MEAARAIFGSVLIFIVLWDAFETIILPRRVTSRIRLARLFYRYTWLAYSAVISKFLPSKRQESLLSFYGPLSLLGLVGLWAGGLILGFAFLFWAEAGSPRGAPAAGEFLRNLYFSGTTFFTLGLGDVTPASSASRMLTVLEVGIGFAFLALIIGYFPSLNQSFSHREVSISLLDARAGSPPTAAEILRRHSGEYGVEALRLLLHDWELWSAEFLESHLSYPVLAYFRSQHDNQSWLAALTAVLDACALLISWIGGPCSHQAERTFANARHALVDLAIIFDAPPLVPERDRLPAEDMQQVRSALSSSGMKLKKDRGSDLKLGELRNMYEPFVNSISRHLRLTIPPFMTKERRRDNWQTSAWDAAPGIGGNATREHF